MADPAFIWVIHILQIFSGLCWSVPVVMNRWSLWRVVQFKANTIDFVRSLITGTATSQILFSIRWVIWPHPPTSMEVSEALVWAGCYVASSACALAFPIASILLGINPLRLPLVADDPLG